MQSTRLKNFRRRLPRFRTLRATGVDTAKLARTGGTAALMHGSQTMGVAPTMLSAQRRTMLAATSPASGLGGQELEVAMIVADGSTRGKVDPAYEAHSDVLVHWAQPMWNSWIPVQLMQVSLVDAMVRTASAVNPWSVVYGPAAALVCTADRLGWTIQHATSLTTDEGRELDLLADPPIVVKRLVAKSARSWRWRNTAAAHPSLPRQGANFGPVHKLLNSKRCDD